MKLVAERSSSIFRSLAAELVETDGVIFGIALSGTGGVDRFQALDEVVGSIPWIPRVRPLDARELRDAAFPLKNTGLSVRLPVHARSESGTATAAGDPFH